MNFVHLEQKYARITIPQPRVACSLSSFSQTLPENEFKKTLLAWFFGLGRYRATKEFVMQTLLCVPTISEVRRVTRLSEAEQRY
jgi:hypothetical protein